MAGLVVTVVRPLDGAREMAAATDSPPIRESRSALGRIARPSIDLTQPTAGTVSSIGSGATAVFVGDSYTSGWNGAGIGSHGWPALVGRARGWKTVNLAVAGTGFQNPGWTDQPIGSRLGAVVRASPDVVFVVGGHNDSRWSAASTGASADRLLGRLRAALPRVRIVVVGPIWQDGRPPARCLVLRDHLRRMAASIGAVFVDPLGEGWFAGAAHRWIGPDGLHPTDAGHRHIAERILAHLAGW